MHRLRLATCSYTERCMFGALAIAAVRSARLRRPRPSKSCTRPARGARRRTAPARQARRRDCVCVRRQQGPQDAARGRAGAREAGADTLITTRRRAVESRARDGGGGGEARAAVRARRQRRGAGAADRQRAARPAARRRGALRRVARGARAGDGARGRRGAPRRAARPSSFRSAPRRRSAPPRSSTPIAELLDQIDPPDVIVHSTSSGGTQAGLVAGLPLCRAGRRASSASAPTSPSRVAGAGHPRESWPGSDRCSAVDAERFERRADRGRRSVRRRRLRHPDRGVARSDRARGAHARRCSSIRPTRRRRWPGSIAHVRARRVLARTDTVLFWHTGGQVGLFA